jgi:hypothetical protein
MGFLLRLLDFVGDQARQSGVGGASDVVRLCEA